MNTCRICNTDISHKRAGSLTCGAKCRKRLSRENLAVVLPVEMTSVPAWVSWKPVERKGKITKRPVQVSGYSASSMNPATWTEYANVAGLERKGFVLTNGVGCIDLDHCIENGVIAAWALAVIKENKKKALLIEYSPSGTGVHIFLPMEGGKGTVIRDGRNIEVYPPDSGRYICVTGKKLAI